MASTWRAILCLDKVKKNPPDVNISGVFYKRGGDEDFLVIHAVTEEVHELISL